MVDNIIMILIRLLSIHFATQSRRCGFSLIKGQMEILSDVMGKTVE